MINGDTIYDFVYCLTIFYLHGISKMSNFLSGGGYDRPFLQVLQETQTSRDLKQSLRILTQTGNLSNAVIIS